jgi:hypothetical protein
VPARRSGPFSISLPFLFYFFYGACHPADPCVKTAQPPKSECDGQQAATDEVDDGQQTASGDADDGPGDTPEARVTLPKDGAEASSAGSDVEQASPPGLDYVSQIERAAPPESDAAEQEDLVDSAEQINGSAPLDADAVEQEAAVDSGEAGQIDRAAPPDADEAEETDPEALADSEETDQVAIDSEQADRPEAAVDDPSDAQDEAVVAFQDEAGPDNPDEPPAAGGGTLSSPELAEISDIVAANEDDEQPPDAPAAEAGMQAVEAPKKRSRKASSLHRDTSMSDLPPLAPSPELDTENRYLYQKYVSRGRIPDRDQRDQLMRYMQRLKVNALVTRKFDEAQAHQNAVTRLRSEITAQDVRMRNRHVLEGLDGKMATTKQRLGEIQRETKKRLKDEA